MIFLTSTALMAWLVAPLVFAATLPLVRAMARRLGADDLSDASEKTALVVMLVPFIVGLLMVPLALSQPDIVPTLAPDAPEEAFEPDQEEGARSFSLLILPWRSLGIALSTVIAGVAMLKFIRVGLGLFSLRQVTRRAKPSTLGQDVLLTAELAMPIVSPGGQVLFPDHLGARLNRDDVAMILAHERAHQRRGDPLYFIVLALLDAIFWFHPGFRWQTTRCRLAAELACDEAVCQGDNETRKAYASLVVKALQHAAGASVPHAPAVFSPRSKGECSLRLQEIMRPSQKQRRAWSLMIMAGLIALPLGIGQWALAQEGASPDFTVMPIEAGYVTSSYGKRVDPFSGKKKLHHGTDVGAKKGTPVKTPAAGVVTFAGVRGKYGNVVDIAHEGGVITRYAQLDVIKIEFGDQVAAGQMIGKVGASGRATAPHLHMEVFVDGKRVDPETLIKFPTKSW